jgi:tryptophan-rich sensory protein
MNLRMEWVLPVLVAALVAGFVAFLGATITDIGPWYRSLGKPAWTPPDAAFGIAWTLIFALTAIAGILAWRKAPNRRSAETLIGLFALNGFLNVFWSLLFFRLQRPDWALVEVGLLWLSIAALIAVTARYAKDAALLLAPYLVWVSFAAFLNFAVVRLNSPFG